MIQGLWTVVLLNNFGTMTPLGSVCRSYQEALDIQASWKATYKCPVKVVPVGK